MSGPSFSFHRSRSAAIGHHFDQAARWLESASGAEDTTAISYAAFELRLEIERIGVEYFKAVNGGRIAKKDVRAISSFKRMENLIYERDGHQRDIDRKLEFLEILLGTLEMPIKPVRPHFGRMADLWHSCSEYCHITWSLAATQDPAKLVPIAMAALREAQDYLRPLVQGNLAWPGSISPEFELLRDAYVRNEVSREQVVEEIRKQGIWCSLERPGEEPTEYRARSAGEASDA